MMLSALIRLDPTSRVSCVPQASGSHALMRTPHRTLGTYMQKRNGAMTRIDYIACPRAWVDGRISTWTDESVHTGQSYIDHIATLLQIDLHVRLQGCSRTTNRAALMLEPCSLMRVVPRYMISSAKHRLYRGQPLPRTRRLVGGLPPNGPRGGLPAREPEAAIGITLVMTPGLFIRRSVPSGGSAHVSDKPSASISSLQPFGRGVSTVSSLCLTCWPRPGHRRHTMRMPRRGTGLESWRRKLRSACKQDRAQHFSDLADSVQRDEAGAPAAVPALDGAQAQKPFQPDVLPELQKADGTYCTNTAGDPRQVA